jgi:hypothetical protein
MSYFIYCISRKSSYRIETQFDLVLMSDITLNIPVFCLCYTTSWHCESYCNYGEAVKINLTMVSFDKDSATHCKIKIMYILRKGHFYSVQS